MEFCVTGDMVRFKRFPAMLTVCILYNHCPSLFRLLLNIPVPFLAGPCYKIPAVVR